MLDLLTVGPKITRPACGAAAAAIERYLLRARTDFSSSCCRLTGQRDGQTDARPFYDAYRILRGSRDKLLVSTMLK